MTRSRFLTEDPHVLGETVQTLVAVTTWRPRFAHPSFMGLVSRALVLSELGLVIDQVKLSLYRSGQALRVPGG